MLSTLILLPIVGAILIGLIPKDAPQGRSRFFALILASFLLIFSFILLGKFDIHNPSLQFSEFLPWIEPLGLNYRLGVDGLSLPLLILNSILTWIVIYGSDDKTPRSRLFYSLIFLVNAGVAGSFAAQNILLFVLFYELELIPLYLLIAIWGGQKRDYAAMKFLIYTAVSGILILAAFLALAFLNGSLTFDYASLNTQGLSSTLQAVLLVTLLIGFGIKTPLVPLHTWLPDAYVEASTPVAILLGGVLAKLGTYGLIRFCLGLFPEAWANLAPSLALWGTISVLYGAITAIAQKDIKRMVAYSSIGHMGYILVACAALTPLGMVGAISQMVSHGLILALLFHLVGVIESKVGTRDLDVLNGLMNPIRGLPLTSALLVLGGMASAGIPGLVGFVAEFLVFQGSFAVYPWETILLVVSSGLTAVYFVILLNRTCFGKLDNYTAYYPKILSWERTTALILTALIFFLGVQPTWLVRWSESTSNALVATVANSNSQNLATKIDSAVISE